MHVKDHKQDIFLSGYIFFRFLFSPLFEDKHNNSVTSGDLPHSFTNHSSYYGDKRRCSILMKIKTNISGCCRLFGLKLKLFYESLRSPVNRITLLCHVHHTTMGFY